jgi:hypothetical protein
MWEETVWSAATPSCGEAALSATTKGKLRTMGDFGLFRAAARAKSLVRRERIPDIS